MPGSGPIRWFTAVHGDFQRRHSVREPNTHEGQTKHLANRAPTIPVGALPAFRELVAMPGSISYSFAHSPECCTTTKDGQDHLVHCAELNIDGIWSPGESGTFEAWQDEHQSAHEQAWKDEDRREALRTAVRTARWVYRNTEPGDPLRQRAIPGYEAYLY